VREAPQPRHALYELVADGRVRTLHIPGVLSNFVPRLRYPPEPGFFIVGFQLRSMDDGPTTREKKSLTVRAVALSRLGGHALSAIISSQMLQVENPKAQGVTGEPKEDRT